MLKFLFAALLISGSPTPAPAPAATKPAAELDAKAQTVFNRLEIPDWRTHGKEYQASFKKLAPILANLAKADKVTLFEGLPHPAWEHELLAAEAKRKDTEVQHVFKFYTPSQAVDAKLLQAIHPLLTKAIAHRGAKGCGGFHPDWSLRFYHDGVCTDIQLCFGCHEIRAFDGKEWVYCDLDKMDEVAKLLTPLRQKRPEKKT